MADPLAEALGKVDKGVTGGRGMRVVEEYGDRPDVLDAIVAMRRDKKLSTAAIVKALADLDGTIISEGAMRTFLMKRGVY